MVCAADFNKDDETLIIDGGDILQGSAFAYYCRQVADSPEVIADIMNDCGYDYYTLGNHDFNYGLVISGSIPQPEQRCMRLSEYYG